MATTMLTMMIMMVLSIISYGPKGYTERQMSTRCSLKPTRKPISMYKKDQQKPSATCGLEPLTTYLNTCQLPGSSNLRFYETEAKLTY